ncbi:MAG TPA: DUF3761 domain-containing protein [Gemmatimonadaceae bacterium]
MRRILAILLALISIGSSLSAQKSVHVRGYVTKSGQYVAPHQRSTPHYTKADNYSAKPILSPYTGKAVTRSAIVPAGSIAAPKVRSAAKPATMKVVSPGAKKNATMPRAKASEPIVKATAQCRDSTLSYSARRTGACSHHRGVSKWLQRLP